MFIDTDIKITTEGGKHFGAVVGSNTYKVQYIEDIANDWTHSFNFYQP